jgi:hypothetical protein
MDPHSHAEKMTILYIIAAWFIHTFYQHRRDTEKILQPTPTNNATHTN